MFLAGDGPTGVLVLSGSSGRVEQDRCRVLAQAGATAASYRWFDDEIDLVPLESFDDSWEPDPGDDPLELVGMYEQSLEVYADRVPAARVPVERIPGEVLLIAGGNDRLWPSLDLAEDILRRRDAAGLPTTIVSHPDAGHRLLLPGEEVPPPPRLVHGGTPGADAELGRRAWPHLRRVLALG